MRFEYAPSILHMLSHSDIGVLLILTQIPEKLSPGNYDIYGNSHQILHVAVILAGLAHFWGLVKAFDYLHTRGYECTAS